MDNNKNNQPKMPRFNMNWIYILIIVSLALFFLSDSGNALATASGNAMKQDATYTKFKEYVEKGYADKVEVNTRRV